MKNLRIVGERSWDLPPALSDGEAAPVALCRATAAGDAVLAVLRDGTVHALNKADACDGEPLWSADASADAAPGATPVTAEFVSDLGVVCVAFDEGDIVTVDVMQRECTHMGALDTGIAAMSWSPTGEYGLFVTKAGTGVVMSAEWEPVAEFDATGSAEHSECSSASISWRGDGAYVAILAHGMLRVFDDRFTLHASTSAAVSGIGSVCAWQPTGAVIAAPRELPHRDDIQLFERNTLEHGSFPLDGSASDAGGIVASGTEPRARERVRWIGWSPSAELLACVVTHARSNYAMDPVSTSSSATDSVESSLAQEDDVTVVRVFYRDNYKWYLKHEHREPAGTRGVEWAAWDEEEPRVLRIASATRVTERAFALAYDAPASSSGAVVVIDANHARISFLGRRVLPPPLFDATASAAAPLRCASVTPLASSDNKTAHAAVWLFDAAGMLQRVVVDVNGSERGTVAAAARAAGVVPVALCALSADRCLLFSASGDVALASCVDHNDVLTVKVVGTVPGCPTSCAAAVGEEEHATEAVAALLSGEIVRISIPEIGSASGEAVSTIVESCGDSVHDSISADITEDAEVSCSAVFRTTSLCTQVLICADGHVAALGADGRLLVDGALVARGCTSAAVSEPFLLYIADGQLHAHHVAGGSALARAFTAAAGKVPADSPKPYDDSRRAVEAGALIVAAPSESTTVVLQMPRGNLEAIHPRALVLAKIRSLLDAGDYAGALEAARRHRIDANVVHDHSPDAFDSQALVRAVPTSERLIGFITALREEDVAHTMYLHSAIVHAWHEPRDGSGVPVRVAERLAAISEGAAKTAPEGSAAQFSWVHGTAAEFRQRKAPATPAAASSARETAGNGKVSRVCELIRDAAEAAGRGGALPRSVLVQLVADVKRGHIDAALRTTATLRRQTADSRSVSVTFDDALEYLTFLTSAEVLFDAALGTYDVELALSVAQRSQRDPGEYLPLLASLRELSEPARRFRIDERLRRPERAFAALDDAGAPDAMLLRFAHRHGLHGAAAAVRNGRLAYWAERLRAESLRSEGDFRAAASALLRADRTTTEMQAMLAQVGTVPENAVPEALTLLSLREGAYGGSEDEVDARSRDESLTGALSCDAVLEEVGGVAAAPPREGAARCVTEAGDWERALSLVQNLAESDRRDKVLEIAEAASSSGDARSAVWIREAAALELGADRGSANDALDALAAAGAWDAAALYAARYDASAAHSADSSSNESAICARSALRALLHDAADDAERHARTEARVLDRHAARLAAVRQRRIDAPYGLAPTVMGSAASGRMIGEDDAFSDAGSIVSAMSAMSFSSVSSWSSFLSDATGASGVSESRRERRRRRRDKAPREGSAEEEAYLAKLLRAILPTPDRVHQTGALLRALDAEGMDEDIARVEDAFGTFLRAACSHLEREEAQCARIAEALRHVPNEIMRAYVAACEALRTSGGDGDGDAPDVVPFIMPVAPPEHRTAEPGTADALRAVKWRVRVQDGRSQEASA